jgi:hypothetical protein
MILHELTMNGCDHIGTSWWGYWPFWSNCNDAAVTSDDGSGFAAAGKISCTGKKDTSFCFARTFITP